MLAHSACDELEGVGTGPAKRCLDEDLAALDQPCRVEQRQRTLGNLERVSDASRRAPAVSGSP
ncbi:MAG: hypothetical protein ACLP0J_22420 [Solirubrobacteraceae bacterium]